MVNASKCALGSFFFFFLVEKLICFFAEKLIYVQLEREREREREREILKTYIYK